MLTCKIFMKYLIIYNRLKLAFGSIVEFKTKVLFKIYKVNVINKKKKKVISWAQKESNGPDEHVVLAFIVA